MADIKFTETASTLGITITESEKAIIAEELGILQSSMAVTQQIFELKLTNLITSLETRGMTPDQVINVLIDDFQNNGQIFGGLKRQLIGDAQTMGEVTSSRLTTEQFEKESGEELGTWVAILVATCEDCLPRHGVTRTYAEWRELGEPRSGFSVCGGNCQCGIFPASVVESKAELQSPLKRTKGKITQVAKEKKKAGEIKNVNKYVNRKLGSIHNTKDPIRKEYRSKLPGFKR